MPDRSKHAIQLRITFQTINECVAMKGKAIFIHLVTRHNICCVIIKTYCVDFDKRQTRHYQKKNKKSWEIISITDTEREENCNVEKAYQNNQTAEPLTNNEINMYTMV